MIDHALSDMPTRTARRPAPAAARRGFTLLETGLAIIIVGSGVLAIMFAQQALHQQNRWAMLSSTGTYLANEMREMTARLPRHDPVTGRTFWGPEDLEVILDDFDDLDDFDGVDGAGTVFSADAGTGPVNARREIIPDLEGWSQEVRVFNVPAEDVGEPGDESRDGTTDVIRVDVVVSYRAPTDDGAREITRLTWISRTL